jgi:hypothetical protein
MASSPRIAMFWPIDERGSGHPTGYQKNFVMPGLMRASIQKESYFKD